MDAWVVVAGLLVLGLAVIGAVFVRRQRTLATRSDVRLQRLEGKEGWTSKGSDRGVFCLDLSAANRGETVGEIDEGSLSQAVFDGPDGQRTVGPDDCGESRVGVNLPTKRGTAIDPEEDRPIRVRISFPLGEGIEDAVTGADEVEFRITITITDTAGTYDLTVDESIGVGDADWNEE